LAAFSPAWLLLFLGGCSEDCPELPTREGERIKVTVLKPKKVCSDYPLVEGDFFILDMEKEYEYATAACTFRSAVVSRLAASYSGTLEVCSSGSEGYRPWVNCLGPQSATCQTWATLSFPIPTSSDEASAKDMLWVHWTSPCGVTDCSEGPEDSYEVLTERVGMGWVPTGEDLE
jgi:hypothetical protein